VEGLGYLHRHGIAHGDVCLANLVSSPVGGGWRVSVRGDVTMQRGASRSGLARSVVPRLV
jgi:hypothetical protein